MCPLQALVHNPLLRDHYLARLSPDAANQPKAAQEDGIFGNTAPVGESIREAFGAMYCGHQAPFNPQSLLVAINTSVETLAGYGQQDAHEFYIAAINGMHQAEKQAAKPSGREEETSVTAQVFGGKIQSDIICCKCRWGRCGGQRSEK